MSDAQRIEALEVRIAYQNDLCKQLDEVVREFADRVERLEFQLEELKTSIHQDPIGPHHDPPPHY